MVINIKKGDTVKVLSGKDRGKTGKVSSLSYKSQKAIVEGANIMARHQRPKKSGEKGQIIRVPRPVPVGNLMLLCPHCGKTTRVKHVTDEKGVKARVCKKCDKKI